MTWRAPTLLFDYLRIHGGGGGGSRGSDVYALYCRYLKALLGVSHETVDNIRYGDYGNIVHLERFPTAVVTAWINGHTADGTLLPGYNDAQTLFMLGEDSSSCMSIKARQRGPNRGLLSLLLHGNVRVLGTKDRTGKLTSRAVVKLLIDSAANASVLYVETPMSVGGVSGLLSADGYMDPGVIDVYDQACTLGELLRVPVIYAVGPSPDVYFKKEYEIDAAIPLKYRGLSSSDGSGGSDGNGSTGDDDGYDGEEIDDYDSDYSNQDLEGHSDEDGSSDSSENTSSSDEEEALTLADFEGLVDYTLVAPWVWVDGVRDPGQGRYIDNMTPVSIHHNLSLSLSFSCYDDYAL